MFKLAQKNTVTWPVTVNIPKDGGDTVKSTFKIKFEVLSQDELDDLVKTGEMLERVVIGWEGVADEDGKEIEFSEEAKKKLLGITYVRNAIFLALGEVNSGRAAARKN